MCIFVRTFWIGWYQRYHKYGVGVFISQLRYHTIKVSQTNNGVRFVPPKEYILSITPLNVLYKHSRAYSNISIKKIICFEKNQRYNVGLHTHTILATLLSDWCCCVVTDDAGAWLGQSWARGRVPRGGPGVGPQEFAAVPPRPPRVAAPPPSPRLLW